MKFTPEVMWAITAHFEKYENVSAGFPEFYNTWGKSVTKRQAYRIARAALPLLRPPVPKPSKRHLSIWEMYDNGALPLREVAIRCNLSTSRTLQIVNRCIAWHVQQVTYAFARERLLVTLGRKEFNRSTKRPAN